LSARLTHLDGSFLRVETRNAHMHVAWSGVFWPAADRPRPTVEALRDKVSARLHLVPRFRQRLADSRLPVAEPKWVDDPAFDVARHVTALGEGAELTLARFSELTDAALSRPLSRTGPLWHIHLAPRLEDGSVGLLFKIHHALVDGKSAVELALLLFDTTPEGAPEQGPDWSPAPAPSAARLALDALVDGAIEPLRAARDVARMAASPGEVGLTGTLRRAALAFERDMLRAAPPSYLNSPIGPRRALIRHRARMSDLLAARKPVEVKLNDVCLTAVAGALRQLALRRGEQPRPLKAMVPVSMRGEDQRDQLGNRISFAFVTLPVDVRSRQARLEQVHSATSEFKRSGRPVGTEAVLGALGLLPAPLKSTAARIAASPRVFNLTVSNVPGPRFSVYMLGAELSEAYPVVPVAEGHALSIGMFSYRDHMHFGLYSDPEALPDADRLPALLDREILALAKRRSPYATTNSSRNSFAASTMLRSEGSTSS
jgi:diacylglycerol O-acyltransferase